MPARKTATKKAAVKKSAAKKPAITDAQCRRALVLIAGGSTMQKASYTLGVKVMTLWDRLNADAWKEQLEFAKKVGADALVQKAEDDLSPKCDGAKMFPHQVTLRAARAKQRLWRAGKLSPKEYGDTVTLGSDPERPVKIDHTIDPSEAYMKYIQGGKGKR